jgi:hypothetical protein
MRLESGHLSTLGQQLHPLFQATLGFSLRVDSRIVCPGYRTKCMNYPFVCTI